MESAFTFRKWAEGGRWLGIQPAVGEAGALQMLLKYL